MRRKRTTFLPPGMVAVSSALLLAGCLSDSNSRGDAPFVQPQLVSGSKPIIEVDGLRFRDLNANNELDDYEDWRLSNDQRVDDLVARMSIREAAGLMMIDTLNGGCEGAIPDAADDYINNQNMRRLIFRNVVSLDGRCGPDRGITPGNTLTPFQAAEYMNSIQELAEASRLGVPVLFKSNARNHYDDDPRVGINAAAGSFTSFPKEPGLAAAALGEEALRPGQGMTIINKFADVMGKEWESIGLRGMYGYMADLSTEPRWYRVHETFTEDSDLASNIMATLVNSLQGGPLSPESSVALTLKHFPGGGPQEMGLDPHYSFGKNQIYPANNFEDHLKPFQAAIDAGVASIMPYYGVPIEVTYKGVTYDQVGYSFSKQVVTDLLRDELGFSGYVNSDTGVITERSWGLEDKTVSQRIASAIDAGTDVLSGFHDLSQIIGLVDAGLLSEERIKTSAGRVLEPMFKLGLFENPYVDSENAEGVVGSDESRAVARDIMRKSIVLLQNKLGGDGLKVLPLRQGASVYVMGIAPGDVESYGYQVTDGEPVDSSGNPLPRPSAARDDYALIRVKVENQGSLLRSYRSKGSETGDNPELLNPLTGETWGAQDPCRMYPMVNPQCVDDMFGLGLVFGGPVPWEVNDLSFTAMAEAETWQMSPSLSEIQAVMSEVGAENTVLSVYFRNPYVLDDASGLKDAGAIMATFGVDNPSLMDVVSGQFAPQGRLPFALANNLSAVVDNAPDAPGYPAEDTLFDFNFGLTFED